MILQALYEYYTAMAAQGKMARRGWSPAKVSFALLIDEQGTLLDVLRLKEKELRGKKEVEVPRVIPARCYADYEVHIDEAAIPEHVTCMRMI